MKRILTSLSCLLLIGGLCQAQRSNGGFPAGMLLQWKDDGVPVQVYERPSHEEAVAASEKAEAKEGIAKPYLIAMGKTVDVSFPGSGIFTRTEDNKLVWRSIVEVTDAKAVGLYYDKFHLPAGVRYFVYNDKGNQVLGAYTQSNNTASGLFAQEPVQGATLHLEVDIDPGVNLDHISLHINKAAVYFRGVDYLRKYTDDAPVLLDYYDSVFAGTTSKCMIDAQCPLGNRYFNQNRTSLSIVIPDENNVNFAWCSANMINRVGNTLENCRNYLLTASHCDQTNNTDKDRYDQMLLRFNYEQPTCDAGAIPEANTLVGAAFVARSVLDTVNYVIKGDFLLLETKEAIPSGWNVTLAGWNRDSAISRTELAPKRFYSFHHPWGDVRKVSGAHIITADSFSQGVTEKTHWMAALDSGYVDAGSSGAALFNGDGYVIGSLTGGRGQVIIPGCDVSRNGTPLEGMGLITKAYYSRLSYNWDIGTLVTQKLRPWLDPTNSGVLQLDGVKAGCEGALDSVNTLSVSSVSLDNDVTVYPNPVTTGGQINIRFNLSDIVAARIDLIDINGKLVHTYNLPRVQSGVYSIATGNLVAGMYVLRITDGQSYTSRKIMVRH